ncbi:MmgE/PrpD family protein [Paracidovorax cattleyae]|uniref:2-methylcitrate dehydratase PrpD n=1 Tax=Paracidovorax cattleyae TaxID=80868 RepID=A0A1H0WA67_9BURK|nr:MmgE/PrpD family protein [Paracidovorax cattleyae]SDP87670.1 2-methylcitrate dehydratase PrpD [Paracidovorax cattleyae]
MTAPTPFTRALAERIAAPLPAPLPPPVAEASCRILADALGVTLGGAGSELAAPLWRYLQAEGGSGAAPVLGSPLRLPPALAALAHAGLGAALDFDDVLSAMPAHPSVLVLGVALAAAAEAPVSGQALIEAHVVGLEAGARMGRLMTLAHYDQGFHASGTLGLFAALAAYARLLRLPAALVQAALGIGASMAAGLRRNFGTLAKPLHSGWAARCAVEAVRLAASGLGAAPDAIEGPAGFADAYGVASCRGEATLDDWGQAWAVHAPGVSLRKFACYNALQRPMQAVLDLRAQLGITDARAVRRLQCRMPPGGMQGAIHPRPATGLEAKFSLPYVLAAGLQDGVYGLASFGDAAVRRPEIARLLERIDAREDPRCRGDDPDFDRRTAGGRGFVEVELWTEDGRHALQRMERPPGHPQRPLNWSDLRDKFADCAGFGGFNTEAALAVFDRLRDLPRCADVSALLAPLAR